jgi:hypothetical protein
MYLAIKFIKIWISVIFQFTKINLNYLVKKFRNFSFKTISNYIHQFLPHTICTTHEFAI